jgi:hypothetical protein
MSQAFIREGDNQWLEDVGPSITSLMMLLTRENNGHPVSERKVIRDAVGKQVHVMSNGLSYAKDEKGKWYVV